MAVEFHVLGDIETHIDGRRILIGPARQQCVLVALLVEANHMVSVDQLLDRVWGDRLPHRPRDTLYGYLSRLRRLLAAADDVRIERHPGGYVLSVDAMALDLHRFRDLVAWARATEDIGRAVALFEQALGLWRSEHAFGSLETPWLNALRAAVDGERLGAELDRNDLELLRGHHSELLTSLVARAAVYPLDERLAGQLMLALYRSGRQAGALDHYQHIRLQLAEDLGIDPSSPLQKLHQQMLTGNVALAVPTTRAQQLPMPRQLPAPVRLFTGRAKELTELNSWSEPSDAAVIVAICGVGGIGKTWLALQWAHDNLERFPDGQLHVNLRGFDPTEEPMPAALAIRGFLEGLGVEPAVIPVDLDAQSALYRSLIAGKRMLVVLDNARDTAQATPLLPGTSTCTVLVTSRHQLTGLVAAHGARLLSLGPMSEAEAHSLLTHHLGRHRIDAGPGVVAALLDRCAGLPLALSILVARAAGQPDFSLAVLAEETRDTSARLDALDAGELTTNLRAVFSCSHRALAPKAAETFRLLGLALGTDIGVAAVVSLTGLTTIDARAILRQLRDAHLVQEHQPGRYRMHDLVRLYAADRAYHDESQDAQNRALRRLVDFYLHTAYAADRLLAPRRELIELETPVSGCVPQPQRNPAEAMAWFSAEHQCLLAAQQVAVAHDWHTPTWQLAWTLDTFQWWRGHTHDRAIAWQRGLAAADRLDELPTQTLAHLRLGQSYVRAGMPNQALDHLLRALALGEESDDAARLAGIHYGLALAWGFQHDYERALHHATCALHLYRSLGASLPETMALNTVGWFHARLGHHEQARAHCQSALDQYRLHAYPGGEAAALDSLGYIAYHIGHHAQAVGYYQRAITLHREHGHTYQEADVLARLGDTHLARGEPGQARHIWHQALALYHAQHRATEVQCTQDRLHALGTNAIDKIRTWPQL